MILIRKYVYYPYQVYHGTEVHLVHVLLVRFTIIFQCCSQTANFRASEIKPCAIREDLRRMQYKNHQSVIYGTIKQFHGYVAFLSFLSALPQNSKPDRVQLWTGLRRAKFEGKTLSSKISSVGKCSSPHSKPISRNYGGIF